MGKKENYALAVKTIKTAILQGQYAASKGTNRIQLATYFAIGKYISQNSRQGFWGKGAIETISEQLRRELPGLRGFSATNMKNMRKFYENWIMLDSNSAVATAELPNPKSAVATADLQSSEYQIDIHQSITIPDAGCFPIEHFFDTPFTHHIKILEKVSEIDGRYYYIGRCACEHMSVEDVEKIIKQDAFHNDTRLPNNFINTISDSATARKAVMMFKDEYFFGLHQYRRNRRT